MDRSPLCAASSPGKAATGFSGAILLPRWAEGLDPRQQRAMLAHELAHNLLGHAAWLDRKGRATRQIRRNSPKSVPIINPC